MSLNILHCWHMYGFRASKTCLWATLWHLPGKWNVLKVAFRLDVLVEFMLQKLMGWMRDHCFQIRLLISLLKLCVAHYASCSFHYRYLRNWKHENNKIWHEMWISTVAAILGQRWERKILKFVQWTCLEVSLTQCCRDVVRENTLENVGPGFAAWIYWNLIGLKLE